MWSFTTLYEGNFEKSWNFCKKGIRYAWNWTFALFPGKPTPGNMRALVGLYPLPSRGGEDLVHFSPQPLARKSSEKRGWKGAGFFDRVFKAGNPLTLDERKVHWEAAEFICYKCPMVLFIAKVITNVDYSIVFGKNVLQTTVNSCFLRSVLCAW